MRRAQILVLGIAIVAAALAVLLANNFLGRSKVKTISKTIGAVKVLVAKKDIDLGSAVKQAELGWQDWPDEAVPKGYITDKLKPNAPQDYSGHIARISFQSGEPIKEDKLIKANEGGVLAAILPAGMRAISTKIAEDSAVGGFILPNDRVDVLLTRKIRSKDARQEQIVADTIFKNVRVLAIGQQIEIKDGKKVATGKTATLELTPSQTETLALATSMGDISLTLRSLAEALQTDGPTGGSAFKTDEQPNAVKMLRYGTWSRAYGVK
jgi:pilus assembly protein CpaB